MFSIKQTLHFLWIGYYVNALERRRGIDLNGDGYIGGEGKYNIDFRSISLLKCVLGYLSMLERATGRDINGDGYIGRQPDIAHGYSSMGYGYGDRGYATNNYFGHYPYSYYY